MRAGLAVAAVLGAAMFASETASAQNTYADAPFQQGSLFYRPSGARPPKKVTRRPAYVAPAAPTQYAAPPRVASPYPYAYQNPYPYAYPTQPTYQMVRPGQPAVLPRTGYASYPGSFYYYIPPAIQGPTPSSYYLRPY